MQSGFYIFSSLLPIAGGIILGLMGMIFQDNLDAVFMMITHRDIPEYIKEKPGVSSVINYLKAIGVMLKALGVGFIVYGVIRIGIQIFIP